MLHGTASMYLTAFATRPSLDGAWSGKSTADQAVVQCSLHAPVTIRVTSVAQAAIAQLGEQQTEDLKVPGSIPGLVIFLKLEDGVGVGRLLAIRQHVFCLQFVARIVLTSEMQGAGLRTKCV